MAWQTPKTNWQAGEVVSSADLNRIEGNINYIEQEPRTPDQNATPAASGALQTILNFFAAQLKRITGKTNWYDAPSKTLEDLNTHINAAAPHSGHAPLSHTHSMSDVQNLDVVLNSKATTKTFTVTVDTAWSGSTPPYTKTVSVQGILATDNPIVDLLLTGNYATNIQTQDEWSKVYRIVTADNAITLYAKEIPKVSFNLQLKVVR